MNKERTGRQCDKRHNVGIKTLSNGCIETIINLEDYVPVQKMVLMHRNKFCQSNKNDYTD
jgi:hypothetical protein